MIKYLSTSAVLVNVYMASVQPDQLWLHMGLTFLILTDYLRKD